MLKQRLVANLLKNILFLFISKFLSFITLLKELKIEGNKPLALLIFQ